jgi:signal transduction histidine kinase
VLDGREAGRILVVERDPEIRGTLETLLGRRWHVFLAEGLSDAWTLAESTPPDLVLTDLALPGPGGAELIRRLRDRPATRETPVVLVTNAPETEPTISGLDAGADDLVSVPFSERELVLRVRGWLELVELRRERTAQARRVSALERDVRARDELLAAAAHELRTPITTLALQADGLLRVTGGRDRPPEGAALLERVSRRLESIRSQVVRLDQLVERLLDVSRLIEGRLDLRPELAELDGLVRDAVDLLRESAAQVGSELVFKAEPGISGNWDRFRVGQVVTNLVSNAIKYGCGRPIEVEVFAEDEGGAVRIHDTGEGIAPEEQERIFDRFARAGAVTRHPGLGLGLWISKQIVEACHGRITVESRSGEGCTFTVHLPRTL